MWGDASQCMCTIVYKKKKIVRTYSRQKTFITGASPLLARLDRIRLGAGEEIFAISQFAYLVLSYFLTLHLSTDFLLLLLISVRYSLSMAISFEKDEKGT